MAPVMANSLFALAIGIAIGSMYTRIQSPQSPEKISHFVNTNNSRGLKNQSPPAAVAPANKDKSFQITIVNNLNEAVDVFWWNTKSEELLVSLDAVRSKDGQFIRSIVANSQQLAELVRPDTTLVDAYREEMGLEWNNAYNRGPATHKFLGGNSVGDEARTASSYNHWLGETKGVSKDPLELVITTRSIKPRIVVIENFMSLAECDHLIAVASKTKNVDRSVGFQRSKTGDVGVVNEIRTSSNTWVDCAATEHVKRVAQRMFELVGIPFTPERARLISEIFQVLEYLPGQQYKAHTDWFNPLGEENAHYLSVLKGRNRYATFFLYLSDVEEGGATAFPLAEGFKVTSGKPREEACDTGFRVLPRKGSAVVFYSMMPDGNLDPLSEHVGCPVKKGVKYAANSWIWDPTRSDLNSVNGIGTSTM